MPTTPDINYPLIKAEQVKDSDYLRIIRQTGLNEAEGFKLRIEDLFRIVSDFIYPTQSKFLSYPNYLARGSGYSSTECALSDPTEFELKRWIKFHSSNEVQELWAQALADEQCGSAGLVDGKLYVDLVTLFDEFRFIINDVFEDQQLVFQNQFNYFVTQTLTPSINAIDSWNGDSTVVSKFLADCQTELNNWINVVVEKRKQDAISAYNILETIKTKAEQKATDCGKPFQ